MICEKCKQEIADNLKFCNKCGAKIVLKAPTETQNTQTFQGGANSQTANSATEEAKQTFIDPASQTTTVKTTAMIKKCVCCGKYLDTSATFCDKCGTKQSTSGECIPNGDVKAGSKSRVTAGLLGIFIGGFGVHNFYLGFHVKAIIQILLSVFCCGVGSIWGLIEGIMILVNKINVDAKGEALL